MTPRADQASDRRLPLAICAFVALLRRDLHVALRSFPSFLAQIVIQPFLLLFILGRVIVTLGLARADYGRVFLFPGVVVMTSMLTSIQGIALPLVIELSVSREIEDRLLAPVPSSLVAIEKLTFSTIRALIATAVMFPAGLAVFGSVPWHAGAAPQVVLVILLSAMAGAGLGLVMATVVPPDRISVAFSLFFPPFAFTGAAQYPWLSLGRLRWFQIISAANPLTYASEGIRGTLAPQVSHLSLGLCVAVLAGFTVTMSAVGIRCFGRRVMQ